MVRLIIVVLTTLISLTSCLPQVNLDTVTPSITSTFAHTNTYTGSPVCNTGGGDYRMDPPTALRLANLFCEEVVKPENFPVEGARWDSAHYPTELTPEVDSPNYTEIELSGLIAVGALYRSKPWWADGILYIEGSDEQCERDNCSAGMRSAIDRCEWNSHYVGGDNDFLTDCGVYSIFIANCSGNWLDPRCDRWHQIHPNVGLPKNESLEAPTSLPASNVTAKTSTTESVSSTATNNLF